MSTEMEKLLEQLQQIAEGKTPRVGYHLHADLRMVLEAFGPNTAHGAKNFKHFLESWLEEIKEGAPHE